MTPKETMAVEQQETARDMLERVSAGFEELNRTENGVVDEWVAAMKTSPLRTTNARKPFSAAK